MSGLSSNSRACSDDVVAVTSIAGLITWSGICVTYLRFYQGMKAQGMDRTKLPYYSKLQPYAAWYGFGFSFFICLVSGHYDDRFSALK